MKYTGETSLKKFIELNKEIFDNRRTLLIQCYVGIVDLKYIENLRSNLLNTLPNAIIIGSTTDRAIKGGKINELKETSISFSFFNKTDIQTKFIKGCQKDNDSFLLGENLIKNTKLSKTKAILTFTDGANTNGEEFLKGLSKEINNNIPISGGMAGNNKNQDTYIFDNKNITNHGALIAIFNSDTLIVNTYNSLNWEQIGKKFIVTKCEKNIIYEINNIPIKEIYKKYLGIEMKKDNIHLVIQFPLVKKIEENNIPRVLIDIRYDCFIYAGNFSIGDEITFGYGNVQKIMMEAEKIFNEIIEQPTESIFIYSCIAREYFLGNKVDKELNIFEDIASTNGFFTLGEFFQNNGDRIFLNQSMTVLTFSESEELPTLSGEFTGFDCIKEKPVDIITHLINSTVCELEKEKVELQRKKNNFKNLSIKDGLTGLYNRSFFQDEIYNALKRSQRSDYDTALFFIDLDAFKDINDTYGHEVGDFVLKEISARLKRELRDTDILSRIGGDEFTIIIENFKSKFGLSVLGTNILECLRKPIKFEDKNLHLSGSIGISIYPDDTKNVSELIRYADIAMYESKNEGKNLYQFYDNDMSKYYIEKMSIKSDLHDSIKNKELEVFFQPQIDSESGKLIGVEALIRWYKNGNFINPVDFIPLAEETDFIIALDEFVLEESIKMIKKLELEQNIKIPKLSVNMSSRELEYKGYFENLKRILKKHNYPGEKLELELTENIMVKNPDLTIKKIEKIQSLGIHISIDDFGTGFSSISYLKKLPINKIKIDRSFVIGIVSDNRDKIIVKTMVDFANGLGLDVIAEGVETFEEVEILKEIGCPNIQGYYYSKPLSYNDIVKYLKGKESF
jgi:diguanylate cyclase (GGDEF)-like protein